MKPETNVEKTGVQEWSRLRQGLEGAEVKKQRHKRKDRVNKSPGPDEITCGTYSCHHIPNGAATTEGKRL